MKFSVCLVLLVTVWQVSAQAPGDENSRCVNQHGGVYPPNIRMLMDSRNYIQLITGSSAVWQARDVDRTGRGWRSSFGGLCAAQPRSCDFRESTPQDNWFFTQYIRYIEATEVFVKITTNFQECRLNPSSCTQLYVDMYRYERNGADATAARNTTNYQLVQRIEQPGGFIGQQYAASFSFTPSGNTNGFYLGFKDTGTCVNILRLQVYYNALQPVVDPPVTCPEVGRPPQGSTVQVNCSCPGNSTVTRGSSLQLTCYPNGTCTGNPSCQCNEGYQAITRRCRVSAQAPGDEDRRCVNTRRPYPPNTRMLMDSRNYEQLITGSSAVWQALNVDGTGLGWRSSFGGLCAAQPRSCDFRESTPQDNWFFTQYIRYIEATEVIVNISANFQECRLNPGSCTQLYVDMYRYERNGVDTTAARNTNNYQFVRRIEQPSDFIGQQYAASFSFIPSGSTNGFYLGFKDTVTCVNLQRLQVYYRISPQRNVGLVLYPEIALPLQGSSGTVTAMATCAANSRNLTNLLIMCFADGSCVAVASCACVPGYEYVAGTGGSAQCRACSQGLYKAGLRNTQCQSCPANSTVVGAVTCNCTRGHYRMNREGAADPCTTPPSAVRNVRVTEPVGNTTVEVHWDPPLSNGGRMDGFHYNVEYREVGNLGAWIRANEDRIRSNMYLVRGLKPLTRYMIRIIAGNNVSDQEPETVDDRTIERVVTTAEGVPGRPQNVHVLDNTTVVFWQAPQEPNGNITGYEVRISTTSRQTIRDIPGSRVLYYRIRSSDVPNDISMAQIEIRARTLAGHGNWSTSVTVEFDDTPCTTQPTTQQPVTSKLAQVGNVNVFYDEEKRTKLAMWHKPKGEVTVYSIRISYEDVSGQLQYQLLTPTTTTWVALHVMDLPSQRPLWIEVQANNCEGSGPWSSRVELCKDKAPGPPSNVKGLCTVVLWARPSQPNGKIREYEVQIYIPNQWYGPVHSKKESDNYHIMEDSDRPSEYQHSQLFVGVRAINRAGKGNWSNQSLGCEDKIVECPESSSPLTTDPTIATQPTTPASTQPTTFATQPTTSVAQPTTLPPIPSQPSMVRNLRVVNMEAFWDPPSSTWGKVTSYLVRLQYERSPGHFVSLRTSNISDPAVHQWKPDPFPSQRPLYFQVRAFSSARGGPWSKRIILAN